MRYGLWAPIPQWVGATVKWGDRYGNRPRAIVIHRMEGSLEGSDSYLRREFADYPPYPRLNASTHWGVGLWNGTPQIRQWVDGSQSAFGWAASPTDVPTPLARKVFGDLLVSQPTWPYWRSTSDLNRHVLAIEVEGFHDQPWESRTRLKVIELINAIVVRYGPMWIVTHTDMSTKPCAGLLTMRAALPIYGSLYRGPALPDTSTGDPDVAILSRIYRLSPRRVTLKPNQQLYKGPGPSYGKHYLTPSSGMKVEVLGKVIDGPELYGSRIWLEMRRYSSGAKGRFFGHASTVQP